MESVYAARVLLNDSIDWPRTGVFARSDTITGQIDRFDRDCRRHGRARVPLIAF